MELLLPMAAKKLDLSFNIDRDVPAWVQADYTRIRQVLMNLIGNAVKFTPQGSVKVLCSLDNERLSTKPGDVTLKFVIEDTGIGLSSSDVDLLFVPFQQADNSSTRRFGGTGLGLSICRQLVKLMGGVIGVNSELEKGSVFWFVIPVKVFSSEESEKSILAVQQVRVRLMEPRPPRILISSPSDAATALLCSMLDGFDVSSVSTVEELEQYLRSIEPSDTPLDCIILDHQAEAIADGIARLLESLHSPVMQDTKLIHLYTPVTDTITGNLVFGNSTSGIIRMTKPPRKARFLRALAQLRKLPPDTYADLRSAVALTVEEPAESQRTLFGNVLIAEDNPVAQKLLVKQLQRFDLDVIATSNGEEAIAEWERHEAGYFSLAMFDHHMPVCDGVEAAKRLRSLENRRKVSDFLPIVALSADCQESTKMLCLSAGMNLFLSKPLKKSDLASLLTMYGNPAPPQGNHSR
jgi:CheY-like chemotaxis protein